MMISTMRMIIGYTTSHVLKNQWLDFDAPLTEDKNRCIDDYYQHRYYILRKGPNTPLYSERFHTYGKNKISHMNNLIVNGEITLMKLINRISILHNDTHFYC